ncbi:hypothetical protein OIB37_21225 [Streptomyces sp. NBC_00820]|uniref:hypothetical protein n=1 Tax=Streptomyces sp. NBC_00820 TaxID=2975842 RepID=UPI002ED24013|nr:hypothetical protein OIB37_21225 [Streptomyces sp. NBC_00820]
MTRLRLGRPGRIVSGFYEGYVVRIHDDTAVTGGYLILLVDDPAAPTDGGDYWVENLAELESFAQSWEIEWLD